MWLGDINVVELGQHEVSILATMGILYYGSFEPSWWEMIWEKAKEGKMSFFVFVYVSVMNIVKYFFNLFLKYK